MNLRTVISLTLVIGGAGLVCHRIETATPALCAQTDGGVASGVWAMLNLPDTGQTQGFTSTFGEDADYTIHELRRYPGQRPVRAGRHTPSTTPW